MNVEQLGPLFKEIQPWIDRGIGGLVVAAWNYFRARPSVSIDVRSGEFQVFGKDTFLTPDGETIERMMRRVKIKIEIINSGKSPVTFRQAELDTKEVSEKLFSFGLSSLHDGMREVPDDSTIQIPPVDSKIVTLYFKRPFDFDTIRTLNGTVTFNFVNHKSKKIDVSIF